MKLPSRLAAVLLLSSTAAFAGPPPPVGTSPGPSPDPEGWSFRFAPYLWAQGLDGTMGVLDVVAGVDIPFSTILSDLDFSFMGAFEARKGRFGFFTDVNYAELSDNFLTPDILFSSGDFKLKQFLGNVNLGWRVVDTSTTKVDLYGGARINWIDLSIGLNGDKGGRVSRSGDETWVDAVAGVRLQTSLGGAWFLRATGDIGAGQSDLTWQLMGLVGYNISENTSVGLGYRVLSTDYNDGGFTYDVEASGPVLGFEMRF